jgi:small subunit ribosomal protein S3
MSVVKRIIKDSIERVNVDELLYDEYEQAGYGGITLTKTPLGTQINLFAMRPGRVIGKRGKAIKEASERLEKELGLPNPQITVVEVELPEMNPLIMASRVANALERGVHFRRAIFWSLRRIMDSGALGCEIILKGPLRSARARFERVVEGYVPKSGDPALRYVKKATIHVKMKRGILGVTVHIVPPDSKFPDKVSLDQLPEIEYQQPIPGIEPDEAEATETVEAAGETAEPAEAPPTTPENLEPSTEEHLEEPPEKSPGEPKEEAAVEPEDVEEPVEPEPDDEDKGSEDEEDEE